MSPTVPFISNNPSSSFVAGFTSSTGGAWQKHDILSWFVCEDPEVCGFRLDDRLFDYHSESKSYTYKFA